MTLLLQIPTPAPPELPLPDPNLMSMHTQEMLLIALTIVAVSVVALFVLRPFFAALARRIEGKSVDHALRGDVEQLRDQIAEMEPLRNRVLELEERLEFTERLLAERRDQDLLGRGRPGPMKPEEAR